MRNPCTRLCLLSLGLTGCAFLLAAGCGDDSAATASQQVPDASAGGSDGGSLDGADAADTSIAQDASSESSLETGAGGTAGTGGADAGADAAPCDLCNGKAYVACSEDGTPASPIDCEHACVPGVGCAACVPGETSCAGDSLLECTNQGQFVEKQKCNTAPSMQCINGACVDECAVAAASRSGAGCEFWAADLDTWQLATHHPPGVYLGNPGTSDVTVKIEINNAAVGTPAKTSVLHQVTLKPGEHVATELPERNVDCNPAFSLLNPGTCLSSTAFRITSTRPITAAQFNPLAAAYSTEGTRLLPVGALDVSYRVVGWSGHEVDQLKWRAFVTIVGISPNTQVTVTPAWRIMGNSGPPAIAETQAGKNLVVTLGPYDVLNLASADSKAGDDAAKLHDFSGTAIHASAPVAVFSGADVALAPDPDTEASIGVVRPPDFTFTLDKSINFLEEQSFPDTSLGKTFMITHSPLRSSGFKESDILRFVGGDKAATVTTNLPAPLDSFTLQPGQVVTTASQNDVRAESSEPIVVGQILVDRDHTTSKQGNPALAQVPAIERFRTEYVVSVPEWYLKSYLVVAAEVGSTVMLDGVDTSGCTISPAMIIGNRTFESRTCQVSEGGHRLKGNLPFGVMAYGYGLQSAWATSGSPIGAP